MGTSPPLRLSALAVPENVGRLRHAVADYARSLGIGDAGASAIAVSEAKHVAHIAKRTLLSTSALAVLAPVLQEIVGWPRLRIRKLFESHGLLVQEWDRVRTDWLTLRPTVADTDIALSTGA